MKHGVLKTFHPMIGRDLHIPWPPGAPSPAPSPVPYITMAPMIGPTMFTATYADDFYSHYYGQTMLKVTDIGPGIPHFGPPSLLLPLDILMSSSKSYFGSSRFQSKGKPIAVSLLFVVNPNLNCGTPVPTPTGMVIAITTHRVNMTLGDIISGVLQMCCDIAVAWAISKLGNGLGDKISGALQGRLFAKFMPGAVAAAMKGGGDKVLAEAYAGVMAAAKSETIANAAANAAVAVAGFFFGSPTGIDASNFGVYGQDSKGDNRGGPGTMATAGYSQLADESGQAAGDYLDGGLPNGYPVEFGPTGGDEYDEDLRDYVGKK